MEYRKFDKGLAVEELVFQVKPEMVDKYVQLEYEIWTKGLEKLPGFAGSEIWVNKDVPGEVTSIIFWTDYALWQAIDVKWLIETEKKMLDAMGEENFKLVREGHKNNLKYKICEYR